MNDLRNSIRGTKEDLEDQLDQVRQIISNEDASFREILQADQARLRSSLENLARAQQITDTTLPEVVIMSNRTDQAARAIFGTDTSHPQFSLSVSDNEAGPGAVMAAGVHTPQTLQSLLGDSQTPKPILALQAPDSTTEYNSALSLQHLLHRLSAQRKEEE